MKPRSHSSTLTFGATLAALGLALLTRPAQATDACQFNLPTQSVCFTLNGPFPPPPAAPTYVQIVLGGVGPGFDVQDGVGYAGWCEDDAVSANPGQQYCDIPTFLRNSTGALPPHLAVVPWDKINYILNHKGSATAAEIQDAIWFFTNGTACPSGGCSTLVDDANANGSGFVPAPGQIVAIILDNGPDPTVQPSFFELTCLGAGGCTLTQGYWKTHACEWPAPFVPGTPNGTDANHNGIPDDLEGQCAVNGRDRNTLCPCDSAHTILVGTNAYNQCQLLCALSLSSTGNAVRILSKQLIAAKLNLLDGASGSGVVSNPGDPSNPYNGLTVDQLIAQGDSAIGSRDILTAVEGTQCGGPNYDPEGCPMVQIGAMLDFFNNGLGPVPHCQ
jgi:hypothetical protein